MVEMEGPSTKPPQISEMFQKFALAFKTKTFELLAGEDDDDDRLAADTNTDVLSLLDSAEEEFIPDQKVVVIKPDPTHLSRSGASPILHTRLTQSFMGSIFANISSFEASYLQLQAAHVPILDEKAVESADKGLVAILQKLTDLKNSFRKFQKNPNLDFDFAGGSFLEFQVQENQSKLRALETMVNQLQSDIDNKDDEVSVLREKLDKIQAFNSNLSKRLSSQSGKLDMDMDVLLTVRVFESMLNDSVKALHCFTKLLIELMRKAGWDLDMAADSVYSDIDYVRKGHNKYVFLSYVCLSMLRGFDLDDFGIGKDEVVCNGSNGLISSKDGYLRELIEHVSCNPMEALGKNPKSGFSKFCEEKYEQLIHPSMESSIFINLDRKEAVLSSWKSLRAFYELFVRMASSMWLLHKLAYSFYPVVEIFRVERGVDFSMVYMEDVTRRNSLSSKSRPKVAFTVIPGFKVGRTIIQSQVYLRGLKCTE